MLQMETTQAAITTGIKEISEALGGGIRQGSLVVIEGESKTGKSVLSQHLAHGTLRSREHSVVYYTAETNLDDLLEQMYSVSLDVRQDFATDRMLGHVEELPILVTLVEVAITDHVELGRGLGHATGQFAHTQAWLVLD